MKKILLAEVIVLVLLVVAAILVSVFVTGKPEPTDPSLHNTTGTTQIQTTTEQATETLPPDPTQGTTAPLPTQAPTEAPTQAPTEAPTQAPTQAPTETEPNEFGITARQYFVYDCESGAFLTI